MRLSVRICIACRTITYGSFTNMKTKKNRLVAGFFAYEQSSPWYYLSGFEISLVISNIETCAFPKIARRLASALIIRRFTAS